MNREYIDDHHVVARYFAHRLSDAERVAFEAYYLQHPEMLEELEATAQLKAGLMLLRETGELDSLMTPQPWYRQRRFHGLGGTLAAVAILTVGAALWLNRHSATAEPWLAPTPSSLLGPLGKPLQAGGTYTILRTRGESVDAQIELPPSPQALELRILPEAAAQPPVYRVTLFAMEGREPNEVASVAGLKPADDEFVPVYLAASKVGKGRYRLVLEDESGSGVKSVFTVEFH